MTPEFAKLLDSVGFETVGSLRHLPLQDLKDKLKEVVGEHFPHSDEFLEKMLKDAQETSLKVFGYERIHSENHEVFVEEEKKEI